MENTTVKTQTKWVMDPTHSELGFKVKHLMISSVKGEFKDFSIEVDGDDLLKSAIKVAIDASSITTKNDDRDNHLRSADFFDVDAYDQITFESSTFKQIDDDEYQLSGVLTMKGVSKEIALQVEYGGMVKDPYGNEKVGFSLSGKISRKDWGLNWNAALEAGGVMVSDEVKLIADVQFVKQAQ
ncbi:Polyisoprenoid-binding protein YceI [Ekhidna lutea]|uniref:Polyisoprenoid-binding protein YceI n=1 Tax=Ekhidna lutea TaxID=447679 RepID=A0A239KIM2_EKHLU|nr:YceI family protein [Ekhidna lutea]SNT17548.1 Polyisoprenoid-binding protein YceI [Ekhidna lutea]